MKIVFFFTLIIDEILSKSPKSDVEDFLSRDFDIHLNSWDLQLVEIENFRNFMDTEKGGTL